MVTLTPSFVISWPCHQAGDKDAALLHRYAVGVYGPFAPDWGTARSKHTKAIHGIENLKELGDVFVADYSEVLFS